MKINFYSKETKILKFISENDITLNDINNNLFNDFICELFPQFYSDDDIANECYSEFIEYLFN